MFQVCTESLEELKNIKKTHCPCCSCRNIYFLVFSLKLKDPTWSASLRGVLGSVSMYYMRPWKKINPEIWIIVYSVIIIIRNI